MEWLSIEFVSALLAIVMIDLVLAGDNAIVIALAARNLPKEQQKRVIWLGTAGAIIIRAVATLVVVWLLKIPGLLLAGGLLLIWIAYKLLIEQKGHDHIQSGNSIWAAIRTIVIADAAMGIDNVLAVAGAAHGNFLLVILGLLISVPIVVWGSSLFIKWVDRFPVIIYVGSGVLALTAGKMITDEPLLQTFLAKGKILEWGIVAMVILGVLAAGKMKNLRQKPVEKTEGVS